MTTRVYSLTFRSNREYYKDRAGAVHRALRLAADNDASLMIELGSTTAAEDWRRSRLIRWLTSPSDVRPPTIICRKVLLRLLGCRDAGAGQSTEVLPLSGLLTKDLGR